MESVKNKRGRRPKVKNSNLIFAENIRDLLIHEEEKGVTLTMVAQELGITRQSLAQYRDGNNIPDVEILRRICNYFNVSSDYLIGNTKIKINDVKIRKLCEYTGLAEESVLAIAERNEYAFCINVLNKLIVNDNFIRAACMIECESHGESYYLFGKDAPEEASYFLSSLEKLILEAISDTILYRKSEISSEIKKAIIPQEEKIMFELWWQEKFRGITDEAIIEYFDKKHFNDVLKCLEMYKKEKAERELFHLKITDMINKISKDKKSD